MATPLEERLMAARPQHPEFSSDARERARAAAVGARTGVTPGRVRWRAGLVRPARLAVGGLGLAALAGLIALLLIAGPHGRDRAAGLRFADRTEGGVALHLRVAPIVGAVPVPDATGQAVRALRGRAQAQGIEGLEAEANADGTIDAWIPVARTAGEVSDLLAPTRLRVFDLTRDQLASDKSAQAVLLRAGARAGAGKGPLQFYLLVRGGRYVAAGPAASRSSLVAASGGRIPRDQIIVSLPAHLLLLREGRRGWTVVRDRPVVPSGSIAEVARRFVGLSLQLDVDGARLIASRPASDPLVAVFDHYETSPPAIVGPLSVDATDPSSLQLRPAAGWRETLAQYVSAGDLGSRLTVMAEAPTGPARVRRGTPVSQAVLRALDTPLPSRAGSSATRPVVTSLLLAVQARTERFGTWSLITGFDRRGQAFEVLATPGPRPAVISGGGVGCHLQAQHPALSSCAAGGGRGAGSAYGRADDRVVRVVAEYDDHQRLAASVANGWWIAVGPVVPRKVFAYDSAGALIATAGIR